MGACEDLSTRRLAYLTTEPRKRGNVSIHDALARLTLMPGVLG
jgi:hypothetical protein